MVQCKQCGHNNPVKAKICKQCGNRIQKVISIDSTLKSSTNHDRTWQLTVILVFNYVTSIILALVSILIVFITAAGLATTSVKVSDAIISLLYGIVPLIIAGLLVYLTSELQDYNNKARIITLVLFAITLLISIVIFSYISIVFSLFALYYLSLDKKTVRLFS